jgi:hypothetical protein
MSVFTLDWRGHGTQTWFTPFAAGVINRHSAVFATICELSQPPGEPLDFPFVGAAGMEVRNIAPLDDGRVQWVSEINWDRDLNFRVKFLVL